MMLDSIKSETAEKAFVGVVSGIVALAAVRLAWPYVGPWLKNLLKATFTSNTHTPSEQERLIRSPSVPENSIVLVQQKVDEEIVENKLHFFSVTQGMLLSLHKLGFTVVLGDRLTLSLVRIQYRKRLRETHPDKTGLNSSEYFIAVRSALQTILKEISSTSTDSETRDFVINIALNELFAIFTTKNSHIENILVQEQSEWKELQRKYNKTADEHLDTQALLIKEQDRCIQQQVHILNQGIQYCASVDTLTARSAQLEADNRVLQNALIDLKEGRADPATLSQLFKSEKYYQKRMDTHAEKSNNYSDSSSDDSEDEARPKAEV